MLDPVLGNDAVEIPARAQDWQAVVVRDRARLLVQESDRAQAELGMVLQPHGRQPADVPGADDQRRAHGLASTAGPELTPGEDDAPGQQVDGGEGPDAGSLRGDPRIVVDENAHRQDDHGREGRCGDRDAQVVQHAQEDPRPVHAADRHEHEGQDREREQPQRRGGRDAGPGGAEVRNEDRGKQHEGVDSQARAGPALDAPRACDGAPAPEPGPGEHEPPRGSLPTTREPSVRFSPALLA